MEKTMRHYLFHGVRLAVVSDQERLLRAIEDRLRHFVSRENGQNCDLLMTFETVASAAEHVVARPVGAGRVVHDSTAGDVLYFDDAGQLYISVDERARLLCDATNGRARASIVRAALDDLWFISQPLFTFPFIELLRGQGRYVVHAAALDVAGKGVLVAGDSGAGKSTLALALLSEGFGFLGDDMVFLQEKDGELTVLGFPDVIGVMERTAALVPELSYLLQEPLRDGWHKHALRHEDVYGRAFVERSRPALLLFPSVSGEEESALEPMSPDEAFLGLISNVMLTDVAASQIHLDLLARLARNCACYRLHTGRDFAALAHSLRSLLQDGRLRGDEVRHEG